VQEELFCWMGEASSRVDCGNGGRRFLWDKAQSCSDFEVSCFEGEGRVLGQFRTGCAGGKVKRIMGLQTV
jgi:hypothetical protein